MAATVRPRAVIEAPAFDLAARQVDCWLVPLHGVDGRVARALTPILSGEERVSALAFRTEPLRNGFVARRAALRLLLARYLRLAPDRLELGYAKNGRPFLAHPAGVLHFNLSHSGGIAFVAVSRAASVGIDIEQVRDIPDMEAVARDHFSEAECDALLRQPAEARLRCFFVTWTRKEAFIKALGLGMSFPLRRFGTGHPDHAPALSVDAAVVTGWSLADLHPAAGFAGALATQQTDIFICSRRADWGWLLPAGIR